MIDWLQQKERDLETVVNWITQIGFSVAIITAAIWCLVFIKIGVLELIGEVAK